MVASIIIALVLASGKLQPPSKQDPLRDDDLILDCFRLSSNGTRLAIAGGSQKGGDWKVLDLKDGRCIVNGLERAQRCTGAHAICLSPDTWLMAVGGNRNRLFLINANTGNLVWDMTNEGHVGAVTDLHFTPDSNFLISVGTDMMLRIWDIKNKKAQAVFRFTSVNPNFNQWKSPLYVERAKRIHEVQGKYYLISHSGLHPDGKTFAVAGDEDGNIPFLDLPSGRVTKTIKAKNTTAAAVQFTSDGKWLLVGGSMDKGIIEIWDHENEKLVCSMGRHDWSVIHLALSPDKKTLITGGVSDGFRVWDVASRKEKFSYFTKDDPRLPRIKIDPESQRKYVEDKVRSAGVAFLPDGRTFLVAPHWSLWKAEIYFHDTETGRPVDFRAAAKRASECQKK